MTFCDDTLIFWTATIFSSCLRFDILENLSLNEWPKSTRLKLILLSLKTVDLRGVCSTRTFSSSIDRQRVSEIIKYAAVNTINGITSRYKSKNIVNILSKSNGCLGQLSLHFLRPLRQKIHEKGNVEYRRGLWRIVTIPSRSGIKSLSTAIGDMSRKLEPQMTQMSLYAWVSVCHLLDLKGWQIAKYLDKLEWTIFINVLLLLGFFLPFHTDCY